MRRGRRRRMGGGERGFLRRSQRMGEGKGGVVVILIQIGGELSLWKKPVAHYRQLRILPLPVISEPFVRLKERFFFIR
jgi:hypothetical protein